MLHCVCLLHYLPVTVVRQDNTLIRHGKIVWACHTPIHEDNGRPHHTGGQHVIVVGWDNTLI